MLGVFRKMLLAYVKAFQQEKSNSVISKPSNRAIAGYYYHSSGIIKKFPTSLAEIVN